jgi:modulator of drug activity B
MNAFTGMTPLPSIHFHDVEKNADVPKELKAYNKHLTTIFTKEYAN